MLGGSGSLSDPCASVAGMTRLWGRRRDPAAAGQDVLGGVSDAVAARAAEVATRTPMWQHPQAAARFADQHQLDPGLALRLFRLAPVRIARADGSVTVLWPMIEATHRGTSLEVWWTIMLDYAADELGWSPLHQAHARVPPDVADVQHGRARLVPIHLGGGVDEDDLGAPPC